MIIETQLLKKYQSKGILVDTNILLLWFVGRVNQKRISRFNRTKKFLPEHYQLLDRLLKFSKVVTTPNILTEVNSLINQMGEPDCSKCLSFLAKEVSKLDEFYLESSTVSQEEKFTKFGLTDSGIISLVQGKYLVLTDDFPLANYLQSIGVDTVNFNYLIDYQWQLKITKIFSQKCQNTVNIAIEKTSDRSPNNKSDRQPKLSINILRENYLQISITTNYSHYLHPIIYWAIENDVIFYWKTSESGSNSSHFCPISGKSANNLHCCLILLISLLAALELNLAI